MTAATDDPLVTTDWLAAHIDDPKVRIIDASYKMPGVLPLPSDDYLAAHIPRAVFFNVNTIADPDDPRPHMYPSARRSAFPLAIPWSPTIQAAGSRRRGRGGCSCRSAIAA